MNGVDVTLDELIALRWAARRLRMPARRGAEALTAGAHASRRRGRGIDFDEVRAYQPGDDIRAMDWRVTARTGKPHTRLFHEERERPTLIAVDAGASMRFGTRVAFKSVVAARVAALWAWCGARNGDRVGGVVFHDDASIALAPRAGSPGVLRLLRALASPGIGRTVSHGTGLFGALMSLKWVARPGSTLVIVSDFRDWSPEAERLLRDLRRLGELVAVHVSDPIECAAPPEGTYRVTDGSASATIDTADAAFRRAYEARFTRHSARLQTACNALGIRLLRVATHDDIVQVMGRELRAAYGKKI
jgi:uncharacterized protein (DUF58 family)